MERMNRTIRGATVKCYHCDSHEQPISRLADFVMAHNSGRRLKTLRDLTPYEFTSKWRTKERQRFDLNSVHQMPGLNNQRLRFP